MTRIALITASPPPPASRHRPGPVSRRFPLALVFVFVFVFGFATAASAQVVPQPPFNDNFINAITLTGTTGQVAGSSLYATVETNEPVHGPGGFRSVWYRWTAPTNGVVTFDTRDSWRVFDFNSTLAVYTGTNVDALTLVANNSGTYAQDALVGFSAFADTNYYIAVAGTYYDGNLYDGGYFYLNWNMPSALELTNFPAPPSAPGEFQFANYAYSIREDDPGYAIVTVQYGGGASGDATVAFATRDGTAVAGVDYLGVSGVVTFAPGETAKTFSIPILDNPEINATNRTILLQLSSPSAGNALGVVSNSTVVITDDEFVASVSEAGVFGFSSYVFTVSERERTVGCARCADGALVTVTRTGGSKGRVMVDYYVASGPQIIDTNVVGTLTNYITPRPAVAYADYTPVQGTLVFDDYQMSASFLVPVYSDNQMNGTAEARLVLANPRPDPLEDPFDIAPTLDPALNVATLQIAPVWPTFPREPSRNPEFAYFSFERLHYRVNERTPYIDVTVLYPPGGGPVSVGLRVGGGTEAGSAGASVGTDCSAFSQILTFGGGDLRNTVRIYITNDTLVEFNEDILMELYPLTDQPRVNPYASHATVTILYDEQPPGALDREWNPDSVEYTDPQWNLVPGANFQVRAVAVQPDGKTVLGGDFTHVNSKLCAYIARLMPDGSLDTSFNPPPAGTGANGFVQAIALYAIDDSDPHSGKILIAGGFTAYNNQLRNSIARLTPDGQLDPAFQPENGADGPIRFLSLRTDGKIFIGGEFLFYNDVFCNGVALLNPDGSLDPAFRPNLSLDGSIWAVAAEDPADPGSRVYIGGDFTTVNGQFRGGIARLNADGSLDASFNPGGGTDGIVYALAVQSDGKLMIGGAFTVVDFRSRNGIARLQPDGTLDTTFDPGEGTDDAVYTMVLSPEPDGRVFIGGIFTRFNETRRIGLARLKLDGTLDTTFMDTAYNQFAGVIRTWSFEPPRFINSIALQPDGNLIVGGSFTNIGGNPSINGPEPSGYTEFTRADKRTRYNIARLLGTWGVNDAGNPNPTQGPGNCQFTLANYTIDEHGVRLPMAFQRISGSLGGIGAYLTATNRTALHPDDYETVTNRLVSWRSGYTGPVYVDLAIHDDTTAEGDEAFSLKLARPFGSITLGGEFIPLGGALGTRAANVTIGDNDFLPGVFAFSEPAYATNENARYAFVTVIRTNGTQGQASVDIFTRNGSALVNQDYLTNHATLTFASGQTNRTFLVELLDDTTVEYDETVLLTLTNAVNALLPDGLPTSTLHAPLTIVDDDFPAGRLNFGSDSFTSREDAAAATITVTRTGGSVGALRVSYTTLDGTATAPADYTSVSNVLYWTNGDTSRRTFTVPLQADGLVEGPETVRLSLFAPTLPGSLGGLTNATLHILDADAYGTLAFSQPLYVADENGTNLLITVVRSEGTGGTVSVDYATVPDAPESSAVQGVDYLPASGTLEFLPGQIARTFSIQVLDDDIGDSDRTLALALLNPVNATLGPVTNALLRIIDDESARVPAGSLDTSYNQDAQANEPVYALALQSDGKLVVGGDFTAVNNISRHRLARLTEDGQLDPSFNAEAGPDAPIRALTLQPDGKLLMGGMFQTFNGVNRSRIARLGIDGSLDISFNPGAGADNPVYAIAVQPDAKILIGGSFSKFNGVSRPGIARLHPDGTLDASFATGAGANGIVYAIAIQSDGNILIGGDFTTVAGQPLARIARLTRQGAVDPTFSPGAGFDGPVRALVIQPDGSILAGGSFTRVNDVPRHYVARLHPDGTLDTAYLDGLSGANSAVYALALQLDQKLLVAGDFIRFNDVTRNRLTRLNPDGTTDPAINFGAGADAFIAALAVQPDRKIIIGGGFTAYNGQPRRHLARLHGGSLAGAGQLEFAQPLYTGSESESNVLVTVRRLGGTTGAVTADYAATDGSAVNGRDYLLAPGTLTFPQGETMQSFFVTLTNTPVQDGDRTLILALDSLTGGATPGPQPIAFVQILDDESTVEFSAADYSVNENDVSGHATLTVLRHGATHTSVAVTLVTLPVTATEDADYLPTETTVLFAPGDTRQLVEVRLIDDVLQEGNETLQLVLSNPAPSNAVALGPNAQATLTLVDDDFGPGTLSFESAIYTVDEAAGLAVVTVLRTNGASGVVAVRCRTVYDPLGIGIPQAGPHFDYVPCDLMVAFADNDTRQTFTVPIINDAVPDAGEIVRLELLEPTGGATLGLTNATLTIVDDEFTPGILTFSTNHYVYSESVNVAPLTILRTRGTTGHISVDLAAREQTALAGRDFVATSLTLHFAEGEDAKTVLLPIIGNTLPNEPRSFLITLSNPANNAALGEPALATVTLLDDDVFPGAVDLGFNAASGANGPVYTLSLTPDRQLLAGGGFTALNGIAVNRLAKVTTNAIVDLLNFNPGTGANSNVFAAVYGPTGEVYVAGEFLAFQNLPRTRVARLLTNGVVDAGFDPGVGPNDAVYAAAVSPLPVYTTGGSSAGGSGSHTNLFSLPAANATLTVDFLGATNQTNTLLIYAIVDTNTVDLATATITSGTFRYSALLAPVPSSLLAIVVNAGSTNTNAWSYTVTAQAGLPGEHQLLIGGRFTTVGGTNRNYVARLNWDGSLDTAFAQAGTGLNGPVHALLTLANGQALVAGDFTNASGFQFGRVARLNRDGSVDPTFNPGSGADAPVRTLAVQPDGRILIGGAFTNVAGAPRPGVARLLPNGQLDVSFDPGSGANDVVHAVAVQADGTILVAGAFIEFNAQPFRRLVRLNPDGSLDATFDPGTGANDTVHTVLAHSVARSLDVPPQYDFGGLPSRYDLDSGTRQGVLNLDYNFFGTTNTLRVYYQNQLLVDTGPTSTASSIAVPFGPGPSTILTIVVNEAGGAYNSYWFYSGTVTSSIDWETWIAVGGDFTAFNSVPRNRIAVLNGYGLLDPGFDPAAATNTVVYAMALHGSAQRALTDRLVVVGDFTAIAGVGANRVGRLLTNGVFDASFNVGTGANGAVRALALQTNGQAVLGGLFTAINGTNRNYLARLNPDGSLDPFYNSGAGFNNAVYAVALQADGAALVGGLFSQVGLFSRNFIARISTNGSPDLTFDPGLGANGPVRALAVQTNGLILIGGDFTEYNGTPCPYLARLNPDGSRDPAFPADSPNGPVHALAVQPNSHILVGGAFTAVAGVPRGRLARLDPVAGALDPVFAAVLPAGASPDSLGANDYVSTLLVQPDGRILVGGGFTRFHGLLRHRLARLLPEDGSLDPTINFGTGADNFVTSLAFQARDAAIIVGGGFATFNGLPRTAIARLIGGAQDGEGTLQFEVADFRVPENSRSAIITVVRQGGLLGTNGARVVTADNTAVAGLDYTAIDQWMEFGPGEIFRTVTVPLLDDSLVNGDRIVRLTLANPTNAAVLGNPNPATLTLLDNECTLGYSAPTFVANENSLAARITVSRAGGALERVTARYASTNGTATAFLDYADVLGTLVLDPGVVAQSFDVPILDDLTFEGDETVLLSLSEATGPVTLTQTNATLILVEDDVSPGVLGFATNLVTVFENQPAVTITVTRTGGSSGTVSARYQTGDGTARANEEYLATSGVVIFGEGETNKTFTIPILDDTLKEGPETIRLTLSNPNGGASLGLSTGVVIVFDDDGPGTLAFTNLLFTAVEGAPHAVVTIHRLGGTAGTVEATALTAGGSAVPGLRYLSVSNRLAFAPGQTVTNILIPLLNTTTVEGVQTVGLILADPSVGASIGTPQATLEIHDDDIALTLAAAGYTAPERHGQVLVNIFRLGNTNVPVAVRCQTSDGTAVAGTNAFDGDYRGTNRIVVFPAGQTNREFVVELLDDTLPEPEEVVHLTLSSPFHVSTNTAGTLQLGPAITAPLTLLDNDVEFNFTAPVYPVIEAFTNVVISVTRLGGITHPASIGYQTLDGSGTAYTHYIPASGRLDFPPGTTSNSFTVAIYDDLDARGDWTVNLALIDPSTNAVIGSQAGALLLVQDNERTLGFSATNYVVNEKGTNAVITLQRRGLPNGEVYVTFFTVDGTAIAPQHYQAVSNQARWPDQDTQDKYFLVPIVTNAVIEGTKTVRLFLTDPSLNTQIGPLTAATLDIVDDAGTLALTTATAQVREGTEATFTLVRTGGTNGDVSVRYVASSGTATAGTDFTNATGIVAFGHGESTKSFAITILDDARFEGLETFNLRLANPTGAALLGSPSQTTVSILDAEAGDVILAGVSLSDESFVPPNHFIDPDEIVTVQVAFRNRGVLDTTNLNVTLLGTNGIVLAPDGVSLTTNGLYDPRLPAVTVPYGRLVAHGHAVSQPFTFRAADTPDHTVTATFELREGDRLINTVSISFLLGPTADAFANHNPITLRDDTTASPYPATIAVAGVPGTINRLTITLHNLRHDYPGDIDMALVAPNGVKVMLMSDAGGAYPVSNATLTFDDDGVDLPYSGSITNGRYRPTNFDALLDYFLDGPQEPFGAALSDFHGAAPNGLWHLYAVDDGAQDAGLIAGGWSLAINNAGTFAPSTDLSLAAVTSPQPAPINGLLTYSLTATNHGPADATQVVLTLDLPPDVSLVSSNVSQGTLASTNHQLVAHFGTLPLGAWATLHATVLTPATARTLTSSASLASQTTETFEANNTVIINTDAFTRLGFVLQDDTLYITWPNTTSAFVLEAASRLAPDTSWTPVTSPRYLVNGTNVVQVTVAPNGATFYRLRIQP